MARRSVLGGLLAAGAASGARAGQWPEHAVTWIVPFPAGGGSDMFARPIAAHVTNRLGQTMVIDNRSGAGGTVGTAVAARAPADGYTVLVGDTGLTYAPMIYPKAGFDFDRDFAPISAFARVPYALVVNPARLDVATLAAFIEAAKKEPGAIDIGSAGLGTVTHLAIGLFEARAGVRLNHVPYRGGAPMLQDLLAGQIGAAFVLVSVIAGYVKSGKLRALAVASRRREALLPDVPAAHEAGLADFRMTTWFGLFAPARTPDAVLDRLHGAVQEALGDEGVKRLWREQGAKVELESRADFARFVTRETERWSRIAKAANVRME
ncbi:MAG: tripartite tricarboxylate transporter substrate binding protein [Reyranella sp.]|uniref:Bug family tripartite tricarboxylate transporter substrate binding protein n=1 Tax=Reyranella sp. TaxID=1929291 RepID=UPI00272F078E|nr:tripartite tricarboxylate transporter substrate binding protein [Reyranella sp.]MDP1966870.1 tripartite tricarboxylate transporter substrate binding protein [Reyranella sp.]MDP2374603.1 tripartite tricarboxylate transporter substrate binding protein [Reyranella sp.]